MEKKRGRPREKNKEEIIIRARLRLDNDPVLREFAQILDDAPRAADVIREAARLYVAYRNGELAAMGDVTEGDDPANTANDDHVSVDDIFGF